MEKSETLETIWKRASRVFMEECAEGELMTGRVLDYGAGDQPYKDLVKGAYFPFDKRYVRVIEGNDDFVGPFDAVICTDVLQYWASPLEAFAMLLSWVSPGGYLLMTYPTIAREESLDEYFRFTYAGVETLLAKLGNLVGKIQAHDKLAGVVLNGEEFAIGYGLIIQRKQRG